MRVQAARHVSRGGESKQERQAEIAAELSKHNFGVICHDEVMHDSLLWLDIALLHRALAAHSEIRGADDTTGYPTLLLLRAQQDRTVSALKDHLRAVHRRYGQAGTRRTEKFAVLDQATQMDELAKRAPRQHPDYYRGILPTTGGDTCFEVTVPAGTSTQDITNAKVDRVLTRGPETPSDWKPAGLPASLAGAATPRGRPRAQPIAKQVWCCNSDLNGRSVTLLQHRLAGARFAACAFYARPAHARV